MNDNELTNIEKNSAIFSDKNNYMESKKKSFDERLVGIRISKEEEKGIISKKTSEVIFDKALGAFPFGDFVKTILDWNKNVDDEIAEAKKAKLFEEYFNKSDETQEAVFMMRDFLTNPQGNVLFNKILRILDDTPPDEDLINQLSSTLKKIINEGKFEDLFSEHKYALTQIEKLSPQALIILADHKNFPLFELTSGKEFDGQITPEWRYDFLQAYLTNKGNSEPEFVNRLNHSILELIQQGYIGVLKETEKEFRCNITTLGHYLLTYLS